jgi:hypothetical protein
MSIFNCKDILAIIGEYLCISQAKRMCRSLLPNLASLLRFSAFINQTCNKAFLNSTMANNIINIAIKERIRYNIPIHAPFLTASKKAAKWIVNTVQQTPSCYVPITISHKNTGEYVEKEETFDDHQLLSVKQENILLNNISQIKAVSRMARAGTCYIYPNRWNKYKRRSKNKDRKLTSQIERNDYDAEILMNEPDSTDFSDDYLELEYPSWYEYLDEWNGY